MDNFSHGDGGARSARYARARRAGARQTALAGRGGSTGGKAEGGLLPPTCGSSGSQPGDERLSGQAGGTDEILTFDHEPSTRG